jgi:hypothetical protein
MLVGGKELKKYKAKRKGLPNLKEKIPMEC